jgi:site-specific DNA recombinase
MQSTVNKAVIYARYSSKNQKKQSIYIQVEACEEFASKNGLEIVDQYCDYAKTGRNSNRAELKRLIADSSKGLFSVVLVNKLDRWFRNQRESLNCQETLKNNGVSLISTFEGANDSPHNKLVFGIQGLLAEHESDTISSRIKGGQHESASKCLHLGGTPLLGYDVDPATQKYIKNEHEAAVVKKIFEMYTSNMGYKEILKYLNSMGFRTKRGNEFSANSLHGLLKNEKYTGKYIYGVREDTIVNGRRRVVKRPREEWTIVDGAMPVIIEKALFEQAQKKLSRNQKAAGQHKARKVYLLSGIIRCGVCGSPMHANTRPDGYSSYDCASKNDHKKNCNNRGVRREDIDNFVIDKLYENLFSSTSVKELAGLLNEYNENMSSEATDEITLARHEYREIKKKIDRLLDFIADGSLKEHTAKNKLSDLEQKKSYARKHLRKMKEQNAIVPIPEDEILDLLVKSKKLLKASDNSNAAERRNFMKSYVKSVIVYEDKIEVKFKIIGPNDE